MGLTIVMVMTLLGVALFEMSTIEAGLARSDALDIQAFYCAEAEAARVYALYTPANDPNAERTLPQPSGPTPLTLANGTYDSRAEVSITECGGVTVTATCKLPNGRTPGRCSAMGTRTYPNPILQFAHAGAGADPARAPRESSATWCSAAPTRSPANIYVSGNVHLRETATVGATPADPPAITVATGKAVTNTSSLFEAAPRDMGPGADHAAARC